MSDINIEKAKKTYDKLCKMLDNRKWVYEKVEEKLLIKSTVTGDDFPIEFIMRINPINEIVSFISFLPFKINDDKRVDLALAACAANYGMADGSFDFNPVNGNLLFRLTSSYKETDLSEDLLEYMLMVSAATVDKYNDKFFMITKGMLPLEQFLEAENSDQ